MILHIVINVLGTLFRLVCTLNRRIVLFCLCNLTMHKIHIFRLQLMNRSLSQTILLKWLLHIHRNYDIFCFSVLFIKDTFHLILPLFRHLVLCFLQLLTTLFRLIKSLLYFFVGEFFRLPLRKCGILRLEISIIGLLCIF